MIPQHERGRSLLMSHAFVVIGIGSVMGRLGQRAWSSILDFHVLSVPLLFSPVKAAFFNPFLSD